jgi:type IX secretion system PorP/SprF family membrane protein
MLKLGIILLLTILIGASTQAQDPSFTQFFTNPLYYNPALSGTGDGFNVRTNYRNFWHKMDNGFNTADITIDSEEPFLSGGIGLIFLSGTEGNAVIRTTMAGLSYSYHLLVIPRRFDIQMGLQGAFVQKHFMTENLIFSDQLDPVYGISNGTGFTYDGIDNVYYPDFATGVNFRYNIGKIKYGTATVTANSGFAMHHITQPNESFTGLTSRLPVKYVIYTNAIIKIHLDLKKKLLLTPAFIYEQQSSFKNFVIGSNVVINPVYAGIWFRSNGLDNLNAIALNAGLNINAGESMRLQIGYSYDINISKYQNLMGDAHEISLRLQLPDFRFFRGTKIPKSYKACYNKF